MSNNNIEIEIQTQVERTGKLLEFLNKEGKFIKEARQIDEYYTPANRDFTAVRPVREWIRLRDSGGKCSINYKDWKYGDNGQSNHCDEYETPVEKIDQLKNIFSALNFKSLAVVDKLRKIWTYQDYEIALDAVKGLGDFVEIEYIGTDKNADPKKVTDGMVKFLKDLGCGQIRRNYVGYPFQLLFPSEIKVDLL